MVSEWDEVLFLEGDVLEEVGVLKGAVEFGNGVIVATEDYLLVYDAAGEWEQKLGEASLPGVPVEGLGMTADGFVVVKVGGKDWKFDGELIGAVEAVEAAGETVAWSEVRASDGLGLEEAIAEQAGISVVAGDVGFTQWESGGDSREIAGGRDRGGDHCIDLDGIQIGLSEVAGRNGGMRRRGFLKLGTVGGAGLLAGCGREPEVAEWSWRGVLFRSPVSFKMRGVEDAEAETLTVECVAEMTRLEAMFSLQNPESALTELNREGVLRKAPREFLELVRWAVAMAERSAGVFDPTIQPYWKFLHEGAKGDREEVMELVDYRNVMVTEDRVAFARSGMAMTLNGMVQGYVTDRIVGDAEVGGGGACLGESWGVFGDRDQGRREAVDVGDSVGRCGR